MLAQLGNVGMDKKSSMLALAEGIHVDRRKHCLGSHFGERKIRRNRAQLGKHATGFWVFLTMRLGKIWTTNATLKQVTRK